MKGTTWAFLGAAVWAAGALAGCGRPNDHPDPGASAPPKEIEIALVTKAMDSEFWLVMADGAKAAAAARPGVKLSIVAPDREINIDQQVTILEDQTRKGVKALVVSPAGSAQILSALEQATQRGVPVILVDTDAPFDKKVTYIGTNNRRGGQLAAKGLADAIGGPAEVALISGVPGNESQDERAQGFIDALASDYPKLKLVARQPGNSERALGLTVMENILTAHPNIKGVFATNDQMALGAMEALEARGLRGKIKIIGFDATKEAVQATVEGRLAGSVAQNPFMMGQRGVEAALAALDGKPGREAHRHRHGAGDGGERGEVPQVIGTLALLAAAALWDRPFTRRAPERSDGHRHRPLRRMLVVLGGEDGRDARPRGGRPLRPASRRHTRRRTRGLPGAAGTVRRGHASPGHPAGFQAGRRQAHARSGSPTCASRPPPRTIPPSGLWPTRPSSIRARTS